MRGKEEAHDYRYFPEPDLAPLELDPAWIGEIAGALPELPDAQRCRLVAVYAIPDYDARILTQSMELAAYFEKTAAACGNPKAASNWIMVELLRRMKADGTEIGEVPLESERLAGLIRLVDSGRISGPIAKEVFEKMYESRMTAAEVVDREGLARIDDADAVAAAVRAVVAAHAGPVAQYRAGKQQTFGFLVGQVMKAMKGKANPGLVNDVLRRTLDGQ
jgi:aspartyl-tRNA(Asn)/glutamyl-tRNA(Gln) amidotransferase subunit B